MSASDPKRTSATNRDGWLLTALILIDINFQAVLKINIGQSRSERTQKGRFELGAKKGTERVQCSS